MNDNSTRSSKKTQSKLDEIIKNITGRLQNTSQNTSLENLSPLRKKSLAIFSKLDKLADKYVKHQSFKALIMGFVRPHITNMITNEVPEKELSEVLRECYEELRPEFEEITLAKELKNGPTDKNLTEKILKLPQFQQYKEIGDVLF